MKKFIPSLLVMILAFAVCFTACDNGTTSGDAYSYAPLVVTGKNFTSKDVTVSFSTARHAAEKGQTLSELETDDSYSITLDEKLLSEGTIRVSGSIISFLAKNGGRFTGTYKDGILRFARGGGGSGGGGGAVGITTFTVTFEHNDGIGTVQKVTVASTNPASALEESFPGDPDAREGYIFSDWNTEKDGNGASFKADTPVEDNKTVYAQWIKTFTVTFYRNDGIATVYDKVSVSSTKAASGLKELYPEDPERKDYTFSGWNDGSGTPFKADTPLTSDISVFAQWSPNWVSVSAGNNHSLAIKADGSLWAWGENDYGQLGRGVNSTADQSSSVEIKSDKTWASVSAGFRHSLAIDTDGNLWAWGDDTFGQLGLDGNAVGDTPTEVEVVKDGKKVKWESVSAGHFHSLAIDTDRNLWAWGQNIYGQLGNTSLPFGYTPMEVAGTDTWLSVSAGTYFSAGVTTGGTLWGWGSCSTLGQPGPCNSFPVQVGSDENWASVSAKTDYTMAVKEDGSLWAWGKNLYGKLGLGDTKDRPGPVKVEGGAGSWTSVSPGGYHTLAIDTAGNLWAWGHNSSGQLGFYGSKLGDQYTPDTVKSPAATWTSVSAGENHSMAIDMDGNLWAWGENGSGQLGLGHNISQKSPTLVP